MTDDEASCDREEFGDTGFCPGKCAVHAASPRVQAGGKPKMARVSAGSDSTPAMILI